MLPRDIIRIEGVRTTNATRTLIDLGAVVPRATLEVALERALHERLATFDRLVRRFFEVARSGRPGIGPLRAVLIDRDPKLAPAESDLETLCCEYCATPACRNQPDRSTYASVTHGFARMSFTPS
jgi:hypothetical protein